MPVYFNIFTYFPETKAVPSFLLLNTTKLPTADCKKSRLPQINNAQYACTSKLAERLQGNLNLTDPNAG